MNEMLVGANRMEFLGHQIGGDVITCSREGEKDSTLDHRKASEIFPRISRVLLRDHKPAFAEISVPLSDLPRKVKSEQVLRVTHRDSHTLY